MYIDDAPMVDTWNLMDAVCALPDLIQDSGQEMSGGGGLSSRIYSCCVMDPWVMSACGIIRSAVSQ